MRLDMDLYTRQSVIVTFVTEDTKDQVSLN